jgi:hypothetical protein
MAGHAGDARRAGALVACEPRAGDAVIFINPPRDSLAAEVDELLERGAAAGAVLLPVAMDQAHRLPPVPAAEAQSFDVVDQLRRRELQDDHLAVLGATLAREAMAMVMPTFVRARLRVFLCHRRADGEGLTPALDRALATRHEEVFRDLVSVQLGQPAQALIDDARQRRCARLPRHAGCG